MSNSKNIIGILKELAERCDSDSHLSEEIENARITPADLANNLLIAVEALDEIDNTIRGSHQWWKMITSKALRRIRPILID